MNIAEQIKEFAIGESSKDPSVHTTTVALSESYLRGNVTQDWDNEATEFDFPDGSVMRVCNDEIYCYGSR